MAAHERRFRLAELARRLGQPHLAAHQPGALGGEGDLQLRLARDRAQAPVTARLNGSVGLSFADGLDLMLDAILIT